MPRRSDFRVMGEFAAAHHGVFNMSQAADLGFSRGDVAAMQRLGVIAPLRSSTWRFVCHPQNWRQTAYAATLGRPVVASHFTAAALHRLDGLVTAPAVPHVACHHSHRLRVDSAVLHRTRALDRRDIMLVDDIPCTTLARTVCDLAALIDLEQLVRAVDDIQRRGASMTWMLQRATDLRQTGRSGPAQVLDVVRPRIGGYRVPDSWFERLLGECLRSPLLPGITRQHTLCDESGAFVARFDLALPWVRLGIEGHSRSYHLGELVERYDEDRDLRAAKQGWEIAYLGFAATRAPSAVRRDIELLVERRARDLGVAVPVSEQRERWT